MNRRSVVGVVGLFCVVGVLGTYFYLSNFSSTDESSGYVGKSNDKIEYEFGEYEIVRSDSFSDVDVIEAEGARDVFGLDESSIAVVDRVSSIKSASSDSDDLVDVVDPGLGTVGDVAIDDEVISDNADVSKTGRDAFESYIKQLGVSTQDIKVLSAMVEEISGFDHDKVIENSEGVKAVGVMQVTEVAARDMSDRLGMVYDDNLLNDEETNMKLGVEYFKFLKELNADYHYVINAYILGPKGIDVLKDRTGSFETDLSRGILNSVQ